MLGKVDHARAAFAPSLELAKKRRDVEMVELAARALADADPEEPA